MSASAKSRRPWLNLLWLVPVSALLIFTLSSNDLRILFMEAVAKIRFRAVIAMIPGQIAATLLCGAALWSLRPGVSFWGATAARLLRDAGDNLLVFLPGFSEVLGARALVLAGGRTRAAVTASALDKLAEMLGQIPYVILALIVLSRNWRASKLHVPIPVPSHILALVGGASLLLVAIWLAFKTDIVRRLIRWLRREWTLLAADFHAQKSGLPLAILLHFIAWAMGGLQFWMGGRALGLEFTIFEAIAIESIAYAGRAAAIFIPAGLVMQEAALVAGGLVFGLGAEQSLALALVLRLRDVVFGVPLLVWPAYEIRHRRSA